MDIEDAFTTEAIELTEANVDEEEEAELRAVIAKVYDSNKVDLTADGVNIAVLSFVAGRAYQADQSTNDPTIPLQLPVSLVAEFIEYLLQKGAS